MDSDNVSAGNRAGEHDERLLDDQCNWRTFGTLYGGFAYIARCKHALQHFLLRTGSPSAQGMSAPRNTPVDIVGKLTTPQRSRAPNSN
jgi:hypothetical protein